MKRLLALLLVMTLVICLLPTVALAAETYWPSYSMTVDKTTVDPGDEITLIVNRDKGSGENYGQTTTLYFLSEIIVSESLQYKSHASYGSEFYPSIIPQNGQMVFKYYTPGAAGPYFGPDVPDAAKDKYLYATASRSESYAYNNVFSMTVTVDPDLPGGDYTIYLNAMAKFNQGSGSKPNMPARTNFGSVTIHVNATSVDGDYAVSIGQIEPVSVGQSVSVPITVSSGKESVTSYNAYDMTFAYDSDKLTLNESVWPADVTVTNPSENTVRVQRYGAEEDLGKAFDLSFTAKAQGTANVSITDARVDMKENAADFNAQAAAIPAEPTTVTIHSDTTFEVEWNGNALTDVTDQPTTAYAGEDFAFTVNKAAGYTYNVSAMMGGDPVTVAEESDGTYTISNVSGNLAITVNKTVNGEVNVYPYLELSDKSVYLITVTGDPGSGNVYKYDGNAMYEAANYGTDIYSYLVIVDSGETAPTDESAKAVITVSAGSPEATIPAGYDVNRSNDVDINDAQLCYDLYMAKYSDFSQVSMEKFLRADANGSNALDSDDAVTLVSKIA